MSTPIRPVAPLVRTRHVRQPMHISALLGSLFGLLMSTTAYAGNGTCFFPTSGDNQTVVQGTRLPQPLVAQSIGFFTFTPPNEPVTWNSNAAGVFFSNTQTTSVQTVPWLDTGNGYTSQTTERVYISTTTPPGPVIVSITNPLCFTPPTGFTINVAPLIAANAFPVTDTSLPFPAGSAILLDLAATHENTDGTQLSAVEVPFTFTINNGPGSFANGAIVNTRKVYSDGLGHAAVDLFIPASAVDGQVINITAVAPGYPSVPFTITVGTPPPTGQIVVISGDAQELLPQSQSEPIVFRLTDSGGILVSNAFIEITEGNAVITESNGTTFTSADLDANGEHTFSLTTGNTPGPISVRIIADAVQPGFVSATVAPAVVLRSLEIVSGDGQSGQVGTTMAEPLVVRLPPALNPASASTRAKLLDAITFQVSRGGAVFPPGNLSSTVIPIDPVTGEASTPLRLNFEVGSVDVTASLTGYAPVTFHLNATVQGVARALTQASTPGLGTTGFDGDPLAVLLTEAALPVANVDIQWQVISGDATLNRTSSTTGNDGRAQTTLRFGLRPGTVVVRATHVLASGALSVDFNINVADPTLTVVSGNNQQGPIGTITDAPIVFQLRDARGVGISAQPISFAVFGDATAVNAAASTDAQGKGGVSLRFGNTPAEIKIDASALSGRLVAVARASSFLPVLTILSGDNQSGRIGTALAQPLVVKIAATASASALFGKGLGGLTVQWQRACGNGTLASATTVTDANGESANQLTLGSDPRCNAVDATIAGVGTVTFHATGTIPENSVLEIVSGNGQALVPLENSAPLKVRLRSASGTPLAGITVHFAADRSEASLTPTDAVTAADGTAVTIARIGFPVNLKITASVPDVSAVAAVEFNLNVGVINTANLGETEAGVARAIDRGCPALAALTTRTPEQSDLLARCSEVVVNAGDDPADVNRALGEMLADDATAQSITALTAANLQLDNLKSRMAALRAGSRGMDLAGLSVLAPGGALPLSLLPSAIALAAGEPPEEVGAEFSRWGFFATGTVGRGDRDPDTLDPGFRYDSYSITAGVDYRATESWILGTALGFNRNNTELRQNQGGMDSSGYTLSGYASFFNGADWYADAVLSFGRNNFDIDRRINYSIDSLGGGTTLVDQLASASPDGDQQSIGLSVGRDFNQGAWTFGPYLRAVYTKLDFDAYSETMSNPNAPGAGLALAVDSRSLKSLQGILGGKVSYAMSTSWGVLLPSAQVEWVNEFESDPELLVTRFVHDPTHTDILIQSERDDERYFNLGVGLSGVFAGGKSAYLLFEHVAGQERMSSNSLAIGVRIEF